jgi:hypothetical protein
MSDDLIVVPHSSFTMGAIKSVFLFMASRINKDLKTMLHPYLFVLKEGTKIQEDFLDYSLLILQVGRPEIIKSPTETQIFSFSEDKPFIG